MAKAYSLNFFHCLRKFCNFFRLISTTKKFLKIFCKMIRKQEGKAGERFHKTIQSNASVKSVCQNNSTKCFDKKYSSKIFLQDNSSNCFYKIIPQFCENLQKSAKFKAVKIFFFKFVVAVFVIQFFNAFADLCESFRDYKFTTYSYIHSTSVHRIFFCLLYFCHRIFLQFY